MNKIYYFNMPKDWEIKECFSHIEKDFIIFDKPVDHGIFERCECQIYDFSCQGCKHFKKWDNELEYGCLCPCTCCKRRASDNYENM